jgi:hypothetical protein
MSWYPTQTNALYVTEELEQESTEYVDSQGRHFIDVDDVIVDHKTAKGYIAIDSASIAIVVDDNFQNQKITSTTQDIVSKSSSDLPIYISEPQEETTDTRVKDSWSSIVDRFSVHDLMNMHYEIDIVYPTKKVLYHDSYYLLYANQVNSARAAELRKSWLANISDYHAPYVNSHGVQIGSHKVSQNIATKWGLVVA